MVSKIQSHISSSFNKITYSSVIKIVSAVPMLTDSCIIWLWTELLSLITTTAMPIEHFGGFKNHCDMIYIYILLFYSESRSISYIFASACLENTLI